jgi:histidine triad (HIT) family protein
VPADIVWTDEHTVAFRDINPQAPVHVLVVPKRHIVNAATVTDADAGDVAALLTAARAVADGEGISGEDRGYRLVFNVGPDALNSMAHLHLHMLGGRAFDWPPG